MNISRMPRIDELSINSLTASALRITFILFAVVCLITIGPFLALSFYTHPSADDFCFAVRLGDTGVFDFLYIWYWSYNGSYASLTLMGMFYRYADVVEHYSVLSFLLFFLSWAGLVFFASLLTRSRRITLPNCMAGLAFLLVYIVLMERVVDGFYWINAGLPYQLANVLLLCLLCMVVLLYQSLAAGHKPIGLIAGTALAVFLAMGMTEVFLIPGITLVLATYIWCVLNGKAGSATWLMLLVLAVICAAIVIGSPGNNLRMETRFPAGGQVFFALAGAWNSGWIIMQRILSEPVFWFASVVWCFYLTAHYPYEEYFQRPRPFFIAMIGLACFVALFVVVAPFWYATGLPPVERISNMVVFVFLVLWVCFISLLAQRFLSWGHIGLAIWLRGALRNIVFLVVLAGFGWFLISHEVAQTAREDLVVKAPHFDEVYQERFRIAREASKNGLTVVRLPPMVLDPPTTIFYIPISNNQNDLANTCFSTYFDLQEVRAY